MIGRLVVAKIPQRADRHMEGCRYRLNDNYMHMSGHPLVPAALRALREFPVPNFTFFDRASCNDYW